MQSLRLTTQGKSHAVIIEKFLAKWLQAQLIESGQIFQEDVARQLKSSTQQKIQIQQLRCLNDFIEAPQSSLWANVAVADDLTIALSYQSDLIHAQSILTLDGYHVGADWVIALHYDEDSQSAQGMLSHQVRLEEIEQQLAEMQPQLLELENQFSVQQQTLQQQQQHLQQQQQSQNKSKKNYNNSMCKLLNYKVLHRLLYCSNSNWQIN